MSNVIGRSNTSSSRLAEPSQNSTLSPGAIVVAGERRSSPSRCAASTATAWSSAASPRSRWRAASPGRLAQGGELVGSLDQGEQAAGDRVARRLRAGGEQQREERVQLGVGRAPAGRRRRAWRARPTESMSSVGSRPLRRDQRGAVLEHAPLGVARRVAGGSKPASPVADVEAGVDRAPQLVAVVLGHAEQDADHLHRQLGGDVGRGSRTARRRRRRRASTARCGGAARPPAGAPSAG